MRPTFDRRLWILLFIISIQCIAITSQQNIRPQNSNSNPHQQQQLPQLLLLQQQHKPAANDGDATATATAAAAAAAWSISPHRAPIDKSQIEASFHRVLDDHNTELQSPQRPRIVAVVGISVDKDDDDDDDDAASSREGGAAAMKTKSNVNSEKCAKNNCVESKSSAPASPDKAQPAASVTLNPTATNHAQQQQRRQPSVVAIAANAKNKARKATNAKKATQWPSTAEHGRHTQSKSQSQSQTKAKSHSTSSAKSTVGWSVWQTPQWQHRQRPHIAHRSQHHEARLHREALRAHEKRKFTRTPEQGFKSRTRRDTQEEEANDDDDDGYYQAVRLVATVGPTPLYFNESAVNLSLATGDDFVSSYSSALAFEAASADALAPQPLPKPKPKRTRSTVSLPVEVVNGKSKEPIIIIDDVEEFDSGTNRRELSVGGGGGGRGGGGDGGSGGDGGGGGDVDKSDMDYGHDEVPEPRVLPLRPVLPNPYDDEEMSVVYAEQHSEIRLMCEVDLDIAASMWYKNGQVVHAMDRTSRATDYRFIKEANGALTITNVMLEDDGKWQCEAENTRRYTENARPVKLVVLDRPKSPYLLIDSRRLDAGNIFVPVKENSELNLACVSEGGNPKPTLTWEVLLSPGVDRHAQKVSAEVLELEEIKTDKDKNAYKINSGAKSEARLPAVYRAHHNARILCVMEHPTLKIRQNASLLLDVQYTPSFAISRTPGFGYPLREGIEVSLKCDVDSNPPSTPRWQKDDGEPPVTQTGDGFLNFTSIRREHSGWYKCTSRHLNFQYSSIGYYLSVRYDSVDVTSEPDDQDISVAAASHNPNKGQLEVQLGGAVTLQCPQGSLGCWSHLDPVTARLRGLGHGLSTPTGQFSLKDVVYQDAGTYKCIGQSTANKKKLEVLQTVGVTVKGAPTVVARNATPVAYPGSPLHLAVEFCANPPAHAARWLHGDRVFTPGNQYGSTVLAYGVTDLPTPYCKEARLTYVSMHERVPRTFYFIVSTPGGVAEATFRVNFTMRYRTISNAVDDEEEELSEPEEIHFPVFGSAAEAAVRGTHTARLWPALTAVGLLVLLERRRR